MGIRDRLSSTRGGSTPTDGTTGAPTTPSATSEGAEAPTRTEEQAQTAKPRRADKPARVAKAPKGEKATRERADLAVWRTRASQLLWTAFVLLALVLAVAALLVAIDANEENGLVDFFLGAADAVDLGVFSRENGIREFGGDNAETKNALFNWGLGAVVYLLLGRLVERIVRPGR